MQIVSDQNMKYIVHYVTKEDVKREGNSYCEFYQGGYLEEQFLWTNDKAGILYIGVGEENLKDANIIKKKKEKYMIFRLISVLLYREEIQQQ